jgi:DNA-binding response OmpR family regulator
VRRPEVRARGRARVSRIILVEDDPSISRGLADNLRFDGHEVTACANGDEGYRLIVERQPDLVVLDLMLPGLSGYEICRRLRGQGSTVPILMLTARSDEADRVQGLDLGADDYVSKPFSIREVLARVRALLRRTQPSRKEIEELRTGDIVVDFRRYEVTRAGQRLDMTRKEFGLLRLLASRAGEVLTRDELLNEVWGYDALPTTRTVDNHIASLRAKLEKDPARPLHLQTVHGVGYKWVDA